MRISICMVMTSVALAACASAPVHYYSLQPPASLPVAVPGAHFALDVLPVDIPPEADRPEWIARNTDGSVRILPNSQWAAPLGTELQSALSTQLENRTGVLLVDSMAPSSLPVLRLKLSIRRFDIAPGHPTDIDTEWSLGAPGKPHLFCRHHFTANVTSSDTAALAAIRQWEDELSDQIGHTILSWDARAVALPACSSDKG